MARTGQTLVRVAVVVRAGAAPLWWTGLAAAAVGALVPGLTGRRIGLLAGAALFLVTAAAVALARRGAYARPAGAAVRAGRGDVLQDRARTVRDRRRALRWWLLAGFLAAVGSSFALPGAGGLWLAGAGAGLWLKAAWLGGRERAADRLLWLPAGAVGRAVTGGGPTGRVVGGYRFTGIAAGDAAPGGSRRR
ncbi:hypothetical protein [Streptomyces sp. NPDC047097]|uniref:hypothetical protein n=1 Tax=Streptomyces sp. NPDC047097 TaxID=3155260 RepID=UPI0033F12773